MNISDSTRTMRRILSVLGRAIFPRTDGSFTYFAKDLRSRHVFYCALIVTVLLFMVSGCGRQKEELDSAKQQIEKLDSEIKKLTEEAARLNQEKDRRSDDLKTLSDRNTRIQGELDGLNKANAGLFAENKEIKKKNSLASEEIASLKREKDQLVGKIEELRKQRVDNGPQPKAYTAGPNEVGPESSKKLEELSPCDAVIAFMKASEAIVRQQKGAERTKSLEQVKQQFTPRMKGAPEKAIKAAEDWVKEGTKFWDKPSEGSTFRLLRLRNTVLEACGKSPKGAGF
ncbi:MAG: hypothetical protein M1511_03270 [Deltaproteobacteria bacterium]|nr:hypothetical protein [Deltaproteobacteria bacterium]